MWPALILIGFVVFFVGFAVAVVPFLEGLNSAAQPVLSTEVLFLGFGVLILGAIISIIAYYF